MSAWKRDQFPLQEKILYDFFIADGFLERHAHDRYEAHEMHGRTAYRIYTKWGVKSKAQEQLGRALNGHVWTFDEDPEKAAQAFLQRAQSNKIQALSQLNAAEADIQEAQEAIRRLKITKGG